jgi:hypothetical protein
MLALATADEEISAALLPQLRGELVGALLANRRWVAAQTRAANAVCQAFADAGLRVATTKGVPLEHTVYGGRGGRKMMDIDLMIHPRDRETARRIMGRLGFVHGVYDWRSHSISPNSTRTEAVYRLNPDHLPHYLRLEPDNAGVIAIDIANSLTWTASESQVDLDLVLDGLEHVPALKGEVELPTLAPVWQFLFTVLHLFREAWFQETVKRGKDMLYKFADVVRIWHAHQAILTSNLPSAINQFGLSMQVGWVTIHTDRTLGTTISTDLGLAGSLSEACLASGEAPGGIAATWRGTMRERLQCRDRLALFSAHEPLRGDLR